MVSIFIGGALIIVGVLIVVVVWMAGANSPTGDASMKPALWGLVPIGLGVALIVWG